MPQFEDHKELLFCGKCPFLKITPVFKNGHDNFRICKSYWIATQQNECRINADDWGETWDPLDEGDSPKRSKACLKLAAHIHSQMAKAFTDVKKEE